MTCAKGFDVPLKERDEARTSVLAYCAFRVQASQEKLRILNQEYERSMAVADSNRKAVLEFEEEHARHSNAYKYFSITMEDAALDSSLWGGKQIRTWTSSKNSALLLNFFLTALPALPAAIRYLPYQRRRRASLSSKSVASDSSDTPPLSPLIPTAKAT